MKTDLDIIRAMLSATGIDYIEDCEIDSIDILLSDSDVLISFTEQGKLVGIYSI